MGRKEGRKGGRKKKKEKEAMKERKKGKEGRKEKEIYNLPFRLSQRKHDETHLPQSPGKGEKVSHVS